MLPQKIEFLPGEGLRLNILVLEPVVGGEGCPALRFQVTLGKIGTGGKGQLRVDPHQAFQLGGGKAPQFLQQLPGALPKQGAAGLYPFPASGAHVFGGADQGNHPRYSRISAALVSGFALGNTFSTTPSSLRMKVERTTPMLTLP